MKAPAFQLYAADFYMDTVSWSPEMVGVYTRLLFFQWVNGFVPNDLEQIARIGGCLSDRKWRSNTERMWRELCHKFATLPDGNLVNLRLEETRAKQLAYIEKQKEKGKARAAKMWGKDIAAAKPGAQPKDSSSSSSSNKKEKNNKKEKVEFAENRFTHIPSALMEKWREVAPGISIPDEIKKAELWLLAHPEKRRSRWDAFLSNWMVRAQDNFIKRGGFNGRTNGAFSDDKRKTLQDRKRDDDAHLDELSRKWWAAQQTAGSDTAGVSPADDVPDFEMPGK